MNKSLLISVLIFISVFTANAQVITYEEIANLFICQTVQMANSDQSNRSSVKQMGDNNSMTVLQYQQGVESNMIFANQEGFGNSGYIKQSGSELYSALWQYQQNNEANIWAIGQRSYTAIIQDGNSNFVNSYIDNQGLLPKVSFIKQQGDDNSIELALLGNGDRWYQKLPKGAVLTQLGNNNQMNLVLEQSIFPGIEITQDSRGATAGATITVVQSAFSFPMKTF